MHFKVKVGCLQVQGTLNLGTWACEDEHLFGFLSGAST